MILVFSLSIKILSDNRTTITISVIGKLSFQEIERDKLLFIIEMILYGTVREAEEERV